MSGGVCVRTLVMAGNLSFVVGPLPVGRHPGAEAVLRDRGLLPEDRPVPCFASSASRPSSCSCPPPGSSSAACSGTRRVRSCRAALAFEARNPEGDKAIEGIRLRAQQTLLGSLAARCSYKLLKRA